MNVIRILMVTAAVFFFGQSLVSAQGTDKRDTVEISLSGQTVLVPVPAAGNKTSVRFENNQDCIEVSVMRFTGRSEVIPGAVESLKSPGDESSRKVRWIPQATLGYQWLFTADALTDRLFENVRFGGQEYVDIRKLNTDRTYPQGSFIGLTVRETERSTGRQGRYYFSALKLFFEKRRSDGYYEGYRMLLDTASPISSTAVSSNFHIEQSGFGVMVPLGFRMVSGKDRRFPMRLDMGVNLVGKLSWLDIRDGFTDFFYPGNSAATALSMYTQPFIVLSAGPAGIFAAADLRIPGLSVNKPNRDQAFTLGICVRPFHRIE